MGRYRVSKEIGGTFTDVITSCGNVRPYAAGTSSTTAQDLTEGVGRAATARRDHGAIEEDSAAGASMLRRRGLYDCEGGAE